MGRRLTTAIFLVAIAGMLASFVALRAMMADPGHSAPGAIGRFVQQQLMGHDPRDPRELQFARAEYAKRAPDLRPADRVALAEELELWEEAAQARRDAGSVEMNWLADPILLGVAGLGGLFVFLGVGMLLRRTGPPAAAPQERTRSTPQPVELPHLEEGGRGGSLDLLRATDPAFSRPVAFAFLQNLHRNAHWASVAGDWRGLEPFVEESARRALEQANDGVREIGEIVVHSLAVHVGQRQGFTVLSAEIDGFREERGYDGRVALVRFMDSWQLRRPAGLSSLSPEVLVSLYCPACQAEVEVNAEGNCLACGAAIGEGLHSWQLFDLEPRPRRPVQPKPLSGRRQAATSAPLKRPPGLDDTLERFSARVPEFEMSAFLERVVAIFRLVQRATTPEQWMGLRPWLSDIAFEQLRFEREQYEVVGQRRHHRDVRLDRVELARVDADPFYTSITVRLWWTMKDFITNAAHEVIEGDPTMPINDSAYWTFQRVHGKGRIGGPIDACPSCGASIDEVDETGTCAACDSWLCDGAYSWVLSRRQTVAAFHDT